MRTEVKTLIAALTTERNSLDRAITALKAMSDVREPAPIVAKPAKRKTRTFLSDDAKRAIALEMRDAQPGTWSQTAERLARQHHAPFNTIYTRWQAWARRLNGNDTLVNVAQPEPELVGALQ